MPTQLEGKQREKRPKAPEAQDAPKALEAQDAPKAPESPGRTVVGWQGMRCSLPPEWNVTGFSMDRDSGYLRIDAPGSSTMTVQIRWTNAAKQEPGLPTPYTLLAPHVRRLLKRPDPPVPKTDLRANLEKILNESARQAKKAKSAFESSIKPEKTEGEQGERRAINFSWSGAGRGQGKIWRCATCNRVVVAQVIGMAKEQGAIASVASLLFGSLQDHAPDGYDRWALYDLQVDIPEEFRLEEQKLLSGYLRLVFARGAERILVDRWGLANLTLQKFTLAQWFQNNAFVHLRRLAPQEIVTARGDTITHYAGRLSLWERLKALREAKLSLRRFPTHYEGGVWECASTNKIYIVQVLHSRRTEGLWTEIVQRCVCH